MKHHVQPSIGNWYSNRDDNSLFEVVASDLKDDYIEVQYFAGEIDEFDYETWYDLDLKSVPEPEDSTGPFELTKEDVDYSDNYFPEEWTSPLSDVEPDKVI